MALHCHRGGTESIEVAGAAAVGRFSAGELCSSHRGRAGPLGRWWRLGKPWLDPWKPWLDEGKDLERSGNHGFWIRKTAPFLWSLVVFVQLYATVTLTKNIKKLFAESNDRRLKPCMEMPFFGPLWTIKTDEHFAELSHAGCAKGSAFAHRFRGCGAAQSWKWVHFLSIHFGGGNAQDSHLKLLSMSKLPCWQVCQRWILKFFWDDQSLTGHWVDPLLPFVAATGDGTFEVPEKCQPCAALSSGGFIGPIGPGCRDQGLKVPHAEAPANFGKGVREPGEPGEAGSRGACPVSMNHSPAYSKMDSNGKVPKSFTCIDRKFGSNVKLWEDIRARSPTDSLHQSSIQSLDAGAGQRSQELKNGRSAGCGFSRLFQTTTSGLKDADQRCIRDVSSWHPLLNLHTFLLRWWWWCLMVSVFQSPAPFLAANTEAASFRQPPPGPGWAWRVSAEVGHFTSFHPYLCLIRSHSFIDVYLMYPPDPSGSLTYPYHSMPALFFSATAIIAVRLARAGVVLALAMVQETQNRKYICIDDVNIK